MFTSRLDQFRRENGVVRFDVNVIPDNQGFLAYKLCAQQERHYSVKYRKGEVHLISSKPTACDKSCSGGKLVENTSPELLLAVGINKRVPAGRVLVVTEERFKMWSHKEYPGGSIVGPQTFAAGKLIQDGDSLKALRTLDHKDRIDLTPLAVNGGNWRRIREKERVITEIVDTIINVGGKVVITNNEAKLRAERERITKEFHAGIQKAKEEQESRRKGYAQEVGRYLRQECGFSYEQVGKLFKIAGPGQCRDAVERARVMVEAAADPLPEKNLLDDWDGINLGLMAHAYRDDRKDWRRIQAGADYIVFIGGVPADKK